MSRPMQDSEKWAKDVAEAIYDVASALRTAVPDEDVLVLPAVVTMTTTSQCAAGTPEMAAVVEQLLNVYCEGMVRCAQGMASAHVQ